MRQERTVQATIFEVFAQHDADSDDFGRSFRAEVGHLFRLMSAGRSN
jgi:hypothetical protein